MQGCGTRRGGAWSAVVAGMRSEQQRGGDGGAWSVGVAGSEQQRRGDAKSCCAAPVAIVATPVAIAATGAASRAPCLKALGTSRGAVWFSICLPVCPTCCHFPAWDSLDSAVCSCMHACTACKIQSDPARKVPKLAPCTGPCRVATVRGNVRLCFGPAPQSEPARTLGRPPQCSQMLPIPCTVVLWG